MKLKKRKRKFNPSKRSKIILKDCGSIILEDNEQITFTNNLGKNNYDVTKKNWGYYATPSINSRLKNNNFNTHIIINQKTNKFFIFLVENKKKKEFSRYLKSENLTKIPWPKKLPK